MTALYFSLLENRDLSHDFPHLGHEEIVTRPTNARMGRSGFEAKHLVLQHKSPFLPEVTTTR